MKDLTERPESNKLPQISYSCYATRSREGEQFIPEHTFTLQLAGTLTLNDGNKTYVFNEGEFRFIKKNQLIKFTKNPPEGGEYQSVSLYFDQQMLQDFSLEYRFDSNQEHTIPGITKLQAEPVFKSFMESLLPYHEKGFAGNQHLIDLKLREALLILLETNPELKDPLFDFTEPGKMDLESFMNKNFHFNVHLNRFAYLTGRSLATFKRDFEKIFHETPSRWLTQKRLQEAHYLIKEKGKLPSDVYLDLGFEDLSHFSFAFKKQFGSAPSKV